MKYKLIMGYIIKYLEVCLILFNEWAVTDLPQCRSLIWKEVLGKEISTDFFLACDCGFVGKVCGDYWGQKY